MSYSHPSFETLEQRELFSISVLNHVLSVVGAPKSPNTITVGLAPSGQSIVATLSYPTKTSTYTKSVTYPLSRKFRMVSISGGNSNDLITVDQTNGVFPILTHINTHNGNDTVNAGSESDQVLVGNGFDSVNSGDGNDSLFSGTGADTLVGGNGNDQLHAGKGHDTLVTGNGNNIFVDPYGHNTLTAGTGHDLYILTDFRLDIVSTYDATKDRVQKYKPANQANKTKQIVDSVLNDIFGF